jgi:dimethylargininase
LPITHALKMSLLTRLPSSSLAHGLLTHISDSRSSISPSRALAQWHAYRAVFAAYGWTLCDVPPCDAAPDSVFVEDVLLYLPSFTDVPAALLLTRTPTLERASERVDAGTFASSLAASRGLAFLEMPQDAHLEGGDILKLPSLRTLYVGQTSRTSARGLAALRELAEPRGWRVLGVHIDKALHLKSAMTALPDGTILAHAPLLSEEARRLPRLREVHEAEGVAVVHLNRTATATQAEAREGSSSTKGALLISAAAPRTAQMLREMGWHVECVHIDEFEVRRSLSLPVSPCYSLSSLSSLSLSPCKCEQDRLTQPPLMRSAPFTFRARAPPAL